MLSVRVQTDPCVQVKQGQEGLEQPASAIQPPHTRTAEPEGQVPRSPKAVNTLSNIADIRGVTPPPLPPATLDSKV